MEKAFHDLLLEANISITTIEILKDEQIKDEQILTLDTFLSLELDHFTSLNKRIKIGQHALLLRLWHKTSGAMERPIPSHKLRSPSPFSSASSQSVQQGQ
uniref:SAM domain-containing protein n=1 Tax=Amphimedon queenslandica TaxID=400682 RepID=A0A1X7TJS8_AMPQE